MRKEKKNKLIPMDEGFLSSGGGKGKANPLNFYFLSHYKQFDFSFLPDSNNEKIFAFPFPSLPNKGEETLAQTCPTNFQYITWRFLR